MSANPSFDEIASATLRNYRPDLISNILGQQALWWQLDERGFVQEDVGGTTLTHPILHGQNTTVRSFRGWDPIDSTPQAGITTVELEWKYIAGTVVINKQEEFENQGKSKIFRLLDGKTQQLEESFQLAMNSQLYGDGTGNGGYDLTGLGLAVEDGTAWSTYGGINSSTYSFWRNQWLDASSGVFTDALGPSYKGLSYLRKIVLRTERRNSRPSLIVTTRNIVDNYYAVLESQQRLAKADLAMGDAGFRNVVYAGIPVIHDEDVPAGTIFALNADYMKLMIGKGMNFASTPFMEIDGQAGRKSTTYFAGNLIVYKRDQQGRVDNVATS